MKYPDSGTMVSSCAAWCTANLRTFVVAYSKVVPVDWNASSGGLPDCEPSQAPFQTCT